jgi:hypothetical protein
MYILIIYIYFMKNDVLYPIYLRYLNDRLLEGKLSRGSFSLLRISKSSFDDFKYRYENDDKFSTVINRDKKIDDLFDDEI